MKKYARTSTIRQLIFIALCLALIPDTVLASGRTETIACDTCDFTKAVEIAEEYHSRPNCSASEHPVVLGQTAFSCPATSKEIIIANPLTRTSYKFQVSTHQQFDWAPSYEIIVENATLTQIENDALLMFYDIDEDFRNAIEENEMVAFQAEYSSISKKLKSTFSEKMLMSSTTNNSECSDHASNILSDDFAYYNALRDEFTDRITSSVGLRAWSDFASEQQITGGLSLGMSSGIDVNFSRIERDYYITRRWPNGDKLVFKVDYHGETRNVVRERRMRTVTERFLNLSYKLMPGSSRIDNLSLNQITRRNTDLSTIPISVCLSQKLSELLEEVEILSGEGGDGTLVDTVGPDASNGGTLIPPAGVWLNLAGCFIVERSGNICRADTGDCIPVKARYIECD